MSNVTIVPSGEPFDYLIEVPPTRISDQSRWISLFKSWLDACPQQVSGDRLTETSIAHLLIHFSQGRLHFDPDTEQIFYVDRHKVLPHKEAIRKIKHIASEWIASGLNSISHMDEDEEVTSWKKGIMRIFRPVLGRLSDQRFASGLLASVTDLLALKADVTESIGADEIAVQVRKLDGTIDLMVYSFSMGSLRAVKDGENVSKWSGVEFPEGFNLEGMTQGILEASRFYSIIRNFFRDTESVEGNIQFFSRWMAYNLAMGNPEQIYTWWSGASGTGKSVVMDIMLELRGNNGSVRLDPCIYQKGSTNPTANYQRIQLKGKAISFCSELETGYIVDAAKIKNDTDTQITARALRELPIHFPVSHSHIFLGNDHPVIHDPSNSLGRRGVHIRTGGSQYRGEQIENFHRVLLNNELRSILYFIQKGFREINELKGLKAPDQYALRTTSNKLEVSEDWFRDFWIEMVSSEQIHISKDKEFILGTLYREKFLPWWNDNCPKRIPPRVNEFGKVLRSANVAQHSKNSNGKIYYSGAEIVGHEVVVLRKKKAHHLSEEDLDKLAMADV